MQININVVFSFRTILLLCLQKAEIVGMENVIYGENSPFITAL